MSKGIDWGILAGWVATFPTVTDADRIEWLRQVVENRRGELAWWEARLDKAIADKEAQDGKGKQSQGPGANKVGEGGVVYDEALGHEQ